MTSRLQYSNNTIDSLSGPLLATKARRRILISGRLIITLEYQNYEFNDTTGIIRGIFFVVVKSGYVLGPYRLTDKRFSDPLYLKGQ